MKAYRNNFYLLLLLWLLSPLSAQAAICDADNDGDADRNDIAVIALARGQAATGPDDPRDGDGDGQITILDARACAVQCTLPRCAVIEPPVDLPNIDVSPGSLDFGDVFVGSSLSLPLTVAETGAATLSVSGATSSGAPFNVFPPTSFDIADGGLPRDINIGFSPVAEGPFNGSITINSNADNIDPVVINVSGNGILPAPDLFPDIDSATSLDFGTLVEGDSVEQLLNISNTGDAPLNVSNVSSDNSDFVVSAQPGQSIPFTLDPGTSQNVSVVFTAPAGSGGTTVTGQLTIDSDDPDESPRNVALTADVTPPAPALINIPILAASIDGAIDASNCASVSGRVQFAPHSPTFFFNATLTDQGGTSASSSLFSSVSATEVAFSGIDACGLDTGILQLSIALGSFDPFIGDPAIKNPPAFPAPVLDPVAAATVSPSIEVCGTSRESTTVKINGGASAVSVQLDAATTAFCLDVPLRPNTENTLVAFAIDDLAAAPKPTAAASPIQVTHVDPSSVIIAEVNSRPLTIEETELLVDNGVIDLDDPTNFNVSMFTIVLTIGQFPVTVTQPVAVPSSPGVGYGGGTVWTTGGGGGGGTSVPRPVTGCTSGCSNIVVVNTPSGQTIPGVIIIDGRIKTLKEFFQVTIAIQNTSTQFLLTDMVANILLPAGLSPVKAGPGTNVADINTSSAVDTVDIGQIDPMQTGTGQFIIRGDGIGTHNVDVDFAGFLSGGGLAQPEPVNGSAGTSVQVFGPPTFDVVVRHPSKVGEDDVTFGEIYDLIVEITNTSSRPALYTSLDMFVGGDAELVDANGVTIPGGGDTISFGHIPAGRAVQAAFRVRSLAQGEIIACQAIAAENISLTVDTGPDGTDCNIANTYPANFEPLPADQPPVVIGINPLNGQPNIPVTTSVFTTLTPESSCIVGDTFTNVVEALVVPGDPTKGLQVISADLVQAGTFYLEELDTFGNPVKHIPTDLTVVTPPAGGTTIATLRLGLDAPHNNSQYFLRDNTEYRATLVGGQGGICSNASGAEMVSDFTWTFSTEQTCNVAPPIASMGQPPNGSIDRPLNQAISIDFTNRMNPASFGFVPGDLPNSSFSVYADAIDIGGEIDITGASAVPGTGVFTNLNRRLIYTPIGNLAEDTRVFIRLTDGLRDVCGNPLQTPAAGVQLFDFTTIPPDTTAPAAPVVNPVPAITNLPAVQVSGQAEAGSTVAVSGGSAVVNTTASAAGNFSISVPLNLNAVNNFSVTATDASANASAPATLDSNGDPLTTLHDNVLPQVATVSPTDGAIDVARDVVVTADFNENVDPATINDLNFTLEGSVIAGTLAPVGDTGFSFTPDNLLDFNKTYNIRIRANGMRDLAGNGLSSEFVASFTTQSFPLPLVNTVNPDNGVQGTTFAVTFSGTDLASASAIISDNPGISGTVDNATDTSVDASITIDPLATTGATTLGLTTLGGSASVPFTVVAAPTLNLAPETLDLPTNDSGILDVSIGAPAGPGGLLVNLASNNTGVATVPLSVVIPEGSSSAPFTVTTLSLDGVATVTASAAGFVSDSSVVTVTTPEITLTPATVDLLTNGSDILDVSINFPAGTGGQLINLSSSNTSVATVPASVVIPQGDSIVSFTVTAGSTAGVATINASAAGYIPDSSQVNVTEPASITLTPATLDLLTNDSGNLQATLSSPAVGPQVINLASSNTVVATVPATVVVPNGSSSVTFAVTSSSTAGSATITASAAGFNSDTSQVNVTVPAPVIDSVTPDNATQGDSLQVTFAGSNLTGASSVVSSNAGVTGSIDSVTDTSVVVNLTVTSGAAVGPMQLGLTTPGGSTNTGFTINPSILPPTLSSLSPDNGVQGSTVNVAINGTGFTTLVGLSNNCPGLVINDLGTGNDSRIDAEFIIGAAVTPGPCLVTVTTLGGSASDNFTVIQAPDTVTLTPSPGQMLTRDSLTMTATLNGPAPSGGQVINLGTDNSIVTVPATVTVSGGATSANFSATSDNNLGTTLISASATGFTGDSSSVSVIARDFTLASPLVGIDRTVTATITLPQPAPTGGAVFDMSVDDPTIVVVSPAQVTIPAGQTSATFDLTGQFTIGSATVTADGTGNGYVTKDLVVSITDRLIDLPAAQELFLGEIITMPILIAPDAAPPGGVIIDVTSSNPSVVQVLNPVVTVPEGTFQASVMVQATSAATGNVTITASNVAYAPDTTQISVTAGLDIVQTVSQFEDSETDDIYFNLNSGGGRFPAPPGGLAVTLTSSDTNCVVANSPAPMAEGALFGSSTLSYGGSAALPCTATVTADGGLFGSDTVDVTVAQVADIGTLSVTDVFWGDNRLGNQTQTTYRVTLSTGSHGGVTVQVKSTNSAAAMVSNDPTAAGAPVAELFVPDGTATVDFYVQGIGDATGNTTITARSPQFTSGSLSVDVVQSVASIGSLTTTTTSLSNDDPFRVQIGYIHSNGSTFRYANASAFNGPLAMTLNSSDPAVGELYTSDDRGATVVAEVPVNQRFTPNTVLTGGVAFDPAGGGTTTLSVTAPGFDSGYSGSSVTVTVNTPTITVQDVWWGDFRLGAGQQIPYRVNLSAGNHGGVTVDVTIDSADALISTSENTVGSNAISLFLPDGMTTSTFYVQGLNAASGITITASQALFTGDTAPVEVVQPVLQLRDLGTSKNTFSADDPFRVRTGYLHANGVTFRYADIRAGGTPVAATLTSDNVAVGQLVTSTTSGNTATVTVPTIADLSPNTVALGGVAFDTTGGGSATVTATAPGYGTYAGSSVTVAVTAPSFSVTDVWWGDNRMGRDQQIPYRVNLGAGAHGGVTVDVTIDSADALISTSENTVGSNAISLNIPDGSTSATFYVQGINIASGITITATQPLFGTGTATAPVEIVQPVLQVRDLGTSKNTFSADDPFRVRTGYLHANGVTFRNANIRAGGTPVVATLTSDDVAVGQLVTSSTSGASATVTVPTVADLSPNTVALGGVAFDTTGGGSATVTATAPGYGTYAGSSVTVAVTAPSFSVTDVWWGDNRMGRDQQIPYRVNLGAGAHGGVTVDVTIDSADALLSVDENTVGSNSISLNIPNGSASATFYVQGINIASGITITATQPLFGTGTATAPVEIVQPVLQVRDLSTSKNTFSADDPFRVRTGYLHANGVTFRNANIRAGGTPVVATLTSDDVAVGQLVTSSTSGASATVTVPTVADLSPNTVALGGVAFDTTGSGSATVTATAPGYGTYAGSSVTVNVIVPAITISDTWWGDHRIGGGLQASYRVTLGASAHGGVNVRVASSDTFRILVSPNATTAGTSFIDLFIPNGQTTASFYVQGINNVTGTVPLNATSPQFVDGTRDVELVQGVTQIQSNLATSTTAGAADDPFTVRVGYVHANGVTFRYAPVSAGDAPLQVLVKSSDPAVGEVQTLNENGAAATVEVDANEFESASNVATGGIAFDPVAAGTTTISTEVIGFDDTWPQSSVPVTVNP